MGYNDHQWPHRTYRPRRFGETSPSHLQLVDEPEPSLPSVAELEHWLECVADPAGDDVACLRLSLAEFEPSVLAPAVQRVLRRGIGHVWTLGWQPAELVRHVRRSLGASAAKIVVGLIALDHADRDPATLDARWVAQLDALGIPADADPDWIVRRARRMWSWSDREMLIDLPALMARLSVLPTVMPPPGGASADASLAAVHHDDPTLERIRALLAKAESTAFPSEADAFTVKAYELMARHSIDRTVLAAHAERPEAPITIRVAVDNPYVDAKSLLLQVVAEHCRARAVRHRSYGFSSLVGFRADVTAAEILFTSLLRQSHAELQTASRQLDAARRRPYRRAFLYAYADRIGERLEAIRTAIVETRTAESGSAIVPLLASRREAVDRAVAELLGPLATKRTRTTGDATGWVSGRLAADRAQLARGDLDGG